MGSEPRRYLPDFIVRVDDGQPDPLNLVVEIKGYRGEDAKEKANTMRAYWVPGVNNLGKFGRWAFAEFTAVFEIEAEFAHAHRQSPRFRGRLMFDITKEDLKDLLREVDAGRLQLPEFQRSYVWNDEDVRSLLASVAKGFPVGALLTLETGGELNFKPRLLEGVEDKKVDPTQLLLDGQQRMTSLFQTTFSKFPVSTKTAKNVEVDRFYYVDIKKAVGTEADIGAAIVGVSADRTIREQFGKVISFDLRTSELEFENDMFPTEPCV